MIISHDHPIVYNHSLLTSGPSIWVKHHKDGGIKGWSRSHVLLISESDMHMLSRSTSRSWCYARSVSQ